MNCPECKKELKKVNVFSQCRQSATVNESGEIQTYEDLSKIFIFDTINIECPYCATDITNLIKEEN